MKKFKNTLWIIAGIVIFVIVITITSNILGFLTSWMGPVQPIAVGAVTMYTTYRIIRWNNKPSKSK